MENFLISSLALVEAGTITLHMPKEDGIQIEVQHEGQTIPERDALRIFDKYPDTNCGRPPRKPTRVRARTGQDIITYHGGHIGVHVNEGPGTVL